jgi:hypothetical protein
MIAAALADKVTAIGCGTALCSIRAAHPSRADAAEGLAPLRAINAGWRNP